MGENLFLELPDRFTQDGGKSKKVEGKRKKEEEKTAGRPRA
jgi:hypothetical protein